MHTDLLMITLINSDNKNTYTMRRKVYMAAGYNTISLGTGRKEFHPKKPRPGIEHYFEEAAKGVPFACIGERVASEFDELFALLLASVRPGGA